MLSPITPELRQRFKLDEKAKGVIVTDVKKGSSAAEKRVRPGDIVRKIGPDHEEVSTPAQVSAKIDQARKNKMKTILFLFEREGNPRFVALHLDDKDDKKDKKKG
jgi:serine protease Do